MTRLLAFYLPQFHPIKQNDEWWGAGFTDWINVSKATPRFKGHYQPHIPKDLGFYDLRLEKTRELQAKLAHEYGIDGFVYYHYWFSGKRLLNKPLDGILELKKPDFPFCLCWANENWTRVWDGQEREILIEQKYSEEDSLRHIEWLLTVFKDSRYIRINNKPLLIIYRLLDISNFENILKQWRARAKRAGFDGLHICAVKTGFLKQSERFLIDRGIDSVLDFQPNHTEFVQRIGLRSKFYGVLKKVLPDTVYQYLKSNMQAINKISYKKIAYKKINESWPKEYLKYPCVFPAWDNSPRRKTATVIQNDDPSVYGTWLQAAFEKVNVYPKNERVVFINAWNEWGEGCHLEPDQRLGRSFLEETRCEKNRVKITAP